MGRLSAWKRALICVAMVWASLSGYGIWVMLSRSNLEPGLWVWGSNRVWIAGFRVSGFAVKEMCAFLPPTAPTLPTPDVRNILELP